MSADSTTFEVTLVTPQGEHTISVGSNQHIWDAAQAAGIPLPALCHQGRCLTCAGRLLNGGDVDQSDSVSYYREDRDAGFVLLCTAKPRSRVRILTHQQSEMRKHRRGKHLPAPYS
ncbi:MAG: ferredoxin [Acidobacteria bacterium]|nr:MAG: ferredoxin [Acidobacteriota bacterium]